MRKGWSENRIIRAIMRHSYGMAWYEIRDMVGLKSESHSSVMSAVLTLNSHFVGDDDVRWWTCIGFGLATTANDSALFTRGVNQLALALVGAEYLAAGGAPVDKRFPMRYFESNKHRAPLS